MEILKTEIRGRFYRTVINGTCRPGRFRGGRKEEILTEAPHENSRTRKVKILTEAPHENSRTRNFKISTQTSHNVFCVVIRWYHKNILSKNILFEHVIHKVASMY